MKLIYTFNNFELSYIFHFSILSLRFLTFYFLWKFDFTTFFLFVCLNNTGIPPLIDLARAYKINILALVTLHLINCFEVSMAASFSRARKISDI